MPGTPPYVRFFEGSIIARKTSLRPVRRGSQFTGRWTGAGNFPSPKALSGGKSARLRAEAPFIARSTAIPTFQPSRGTRRLA